MIRRATWVGLACAWAILSAISAHATTMVALSTDELFKRSDAVAVVQVGAVSSARTGGRITTHVQLAVGEIFKGLETDTIITVLVPGGSVDRWEQQIEGAPTFTAGETCVVFLKRSAAGIYHVEGLEQGKLAIDHDPSQGWIVRRSTTARLLAASGAGWHDAPPPPPTEPMDAYFATLRRLSGTAR